MHNTYANDSWYKCAWLFLSLTYVLLIHTWSPGSNWLCKLLSNSLAFKTKLIPICDYWVYFPRYSHWLEELQSQIRDWFITDLANDLVTKISVTKIETKFMSKVHCYILATDLETDLKTEKSASILVTDLSVANSSIGHCLTLVTNDFKSVAKSISNFSIAKIFSNQQFSDRNFGH